MEPIRILHVLNSMNFGGAETFIMNVYRQIDRTKIQFDFMLHNKSESSYDGEIKALGGRIYRLPKYRIYNHFDYCRKWDSFLKEHTEYRIVHCHQYNIASVVLNVAKKNHRTAVCHSHSTHSDVGIKHFIKSIYKRNINSVTDYAFACGEKAGYFLYGNSNFKVVANGINAEKFLFKESIRSKIRQEYHIAPEDFVLGHVGRFDVVKNHNFLIEVFKEYLQQNKNAFLVMIGTGETKKEIVAKVKEYGIDSRVLFLENCSNVNEILSAFDVFLLPSFYEGLPVTVVEAQANGLKCLISDTITDEVVISDLVTRLPIDSGVNIWTEKFSDAIDYKRKDMRDIIRKSGYDIQETVDFLTEFYTKQS